LLWLLLRLLLRLSLPRRRRRIRLLPYAAVTVKIIVVDVRGRCLSIQHIDGLGVYYAICCSANTAAAGILRTNLCLCTHVTALLLRPTLFIPNAIEPPVILAFFASELVQAVR
jgi:hypothetical protein